MSPSALAWLATVPLAAAACGPVQPGPPKPAHALEGSLSVLVDLGFDVAHVDVSDNDLAVRYGRKQGDGEDTVFKATAIISDLVLVQNGSIDLAEVLPSGVQRGLMSRDVLNDPRRAFPKLQRGRVILDRVPVSGENVNVDLAVTFEAGIDFASGRTVFGKFEANVL